MPTIADFKKIVSITPEDQAILLKGIHGIGKSESIKSSMEELGYRMVTLFLGQAADAGDIVGLPDKRTIKMKYTDENGVEKFDDVNVTDFNPPKWWPFDMSEKVIIFLDEINRGKPEIMQCIMDMVLNRKLNGRMLPPMTRIIAAMNPVDDGYYQVEELDPALLDRFNVYDFTPSHEEWISWASDNDRVHPIVVGFISKHTEMLDPPSSKETKAGDVNPSRRSWVRVSNIIKRDPTILSGNRTTLKNTLFGVIGIRCASAFDKYVAEVGSGLTPELILTKWTSKLEKSIKAMQITEQIHMNGQICNWFREKTDYLLKKENAATAKKWADNLQNYLEAGHIEGMASFFTELSKMQQDGQKWTRIILASNETVGKKFLDTIRGNN
jgi:hypothetical protein